MNGYAPWLTLGLLGAYHGLNPGMGWLFSHYSLAKMEKEADERLRRMGPGVTTFKAPLSPVFGTSIDGKFSVAHGLVVLFFAALGVVAAPCIKWRFSLRTLLIATTLVAVVLGLIVWSAA